MIASPPGSGRPVPPARPTPSEPTVAIDTEMIYLHPGQMFAAAHRCAITTVLGSCVAVCLHDEGSGIGGVNHYLLPHEGPQGYGPLRCGPTAIRALIESVTTLGARRECLVAKVYGGAHLLKAMTGERWQLGAANVEIAREVLGASGIPVRDMDVGGLRGRKLQFLTGTGAVWVKEI